MKKTWWKEGIVYQIYPRSFMDANGDGIGDFRGIIDKLDYLEELGITIIWLNPVYQSPNDDNGYDISDYQQTMKEFGTLEDWQELLDKLHARGIRLIMDLVVNHSSDEHAWFVESKKGKDNPYRDYYIWKDPKIDSQGKPVPPNNWRSSFSGSAWEFDEPSGQYYLHLFSKKQPDMNWENRKLRDEVFNMMNWWFDKGIDGFRMDVINLISKYPEYADFDYSPDRKPEWEQKTYINGPRMHEFLKEMNSKCMSHYDVFTVGECFATPPDVAEKLVGADQNELDMIFQMEHVQLGEGPGGKWDIQPWKLSDMKKILAKWDGVMQNCGGWNSQFLMNHDQPRSLSRYADDGEYREISAKMLAVFLLTLRGTPFIYQGEEIGMTNIPVSDIKDYRDIEILNHYKEATARGEDPEELMKAYNKVGRDNARTPMQWNAGQNAGFSTAEPWLMVNPNYKEINVEANRADSDSVLSFYKKMIRFRKDNPTLVYGEFELACPEDEAVFAHYRTDGEASFFVASNFSGKEQSLDFESDKYDLVIQNYPGKESDPARLRPYEARVYRLS